MPQLTLTAAPINISGIGGRGISGQNLSLVTLYLSELPDVSSRIFQASIGPQGTFTWPGNKPLYIATDGAIGTITYSNNGADFQTGTAITAPKNDLKFLATFSCTYTTAIAPGNTLQTIGPNLDVSEYSSIYVTITLPFAVPLTAQSVVNGIELTLSTGGTFHRPQWWLANDMPYIGNTGLRYYHLPVYGTTLTSFINIYKAAITAAGGTVTVAIYGSHEVITTPRYMNGGGGTSGNVSDGGIYTSTSTGVGTVQSFPAHKSGPAVLTNRRVTGTTEAGRWALENILLDSSGAPPSQILAAGRVDVGLGNGGGTVTQLILPNKPLRFSNIQEAAGTLTYSLLQ